jgi:hypothetical protein
MAAREDAEELQERVLILADDGKSAELKVLLEEHPEVDVDEYKDEDGDTTLYHACWSGQTECARLLIDHKADVNARDLDGWSALGGAVVSDHLSCVELLVQNGADVNSQTDHGPTPLMFSVNNLTMAQCLLDHKADVHYRVSEEKFEKNKDVLYWAMCTSVTDNGVAFAFLSCNTDAKNVEIGYSLTAAIRDTHIEQYKHVQAYIDEYHGLLNHVLSERVEVDTRVGLTQNGIYQEPLERTLGYLGLSMSEDQVVNTSIDGEEGVRRALIPGHLLNANHWFDKYESHKEKVGLLMQYSNELEASEQLTRELKTKIAALLA